MAREIRITVDDDEVFERMKARKHELELSWEEVLHRGLRREDAHPRTDRGGARSRYRPEQPPDSPPPSDPIGNPAGFAEDLKRQIQGQVRDSLQASFETDTDLDREVATLESAEDAVLVFEFLGERADERALQVPLRVTLKASTDGLGVDVVAVRHGKTVADTNAFDPDARKRVIEGLAAGEGATLRLAAGEEEYVVDPVLSWTRADGTPTVGSVSIENVRFDDGS